MTTGQRFKQVVELIKVRTGKSLQKICEELGISYSMLSQYNTNRHKPKESIVNYLSSLYGVNKEYILSGEGEPFESNYIVKEEKESYNIAKQILDYLAEIPVYETPAYANQGTILSLDYYQTGEKVFKMKFPIKDTKNLGALKVTGESLINLGILEDDYVLFDKSINPKDGDIVVAQLNGELLVKVFNKNGETIELGSKDGRTKPIKENYDDDCKIIGRVIGVHREI